TTDHWLLTNALRRDLPHHAVSVRSALRSHAEKIAVAVPRHSAFREIRAVEGEVVQVGEHPAAIGWTQFEDVAGHSCQASDWFWARHDNSPRPFSHFSVILHCGTTTLCE